MQANIDLKLLKTIHTLVYCGSATSAAKILNLTPAAISYQLNKARQITGAHLFIRTRSGMTPDTRARELSQVYLQLVGDKNHTLVCDDELIPKRKTLTFNTPSLMEMMVSEIIFNPDVERKPFRYTFKPYVQNAIERLNSLKNGSVDMDIGCQLPADKNIRRVQLLSSRMSVLTSAKYDDHGNSFTLDDWYAAQHISWFGAGSYYNIDIRSSYEASRHYENRRIGHVCGSLINMVYLCSLSHYVMLIPDFFAPMLTASFPLKCMELPPELDIRYSFSMHYHTSLLQESDTFDHVHDLLSRIITASHPSITRSVIIP
jgi:DNA-binding transcriptional LysR family regulator